MVKKLGDMIISILFLLTLESYRYNVVVILFSFHLFVVLFVLLLFCGVLVVLVVVSCFSKREREHEPKKKRILEGLQSRLI